MHLMVTDRTFVFCLYFSDDINPADIDDIVLGLISVLEGRHHCSVQPDAESYAEIRLTVEPVDCLSKERFIIDLMSFLDFYLRMQKYQGYYAVQSADDRENSTVSIVHIPSGSFRGGNPAK